MSRVAIVGSGPAGFYTALRVLSKNKNISIDIFEKLPVPFGLARFGVAPDHPEVKNCEERFQEVAESPLVNFYGNVNVGTDVSIPSLVNNYNAVLFSYGAQTERQLGVPGESSPGVISARQFVGWYNGDPACQDLVFPLNKAENITIIGNGNVALDVARILLRKPDDLRHTDITEHALSVLAESKVKHVDIVGRRGLIQSAFTNKELRELLTEPGVAMKPFDLSPFDQYKSALGRADQRMLTLLHKGSTTGWDEAARTWQFSFLRSPKEFHASASDKSLLTSIDWEKNVLTSEDPNDGVIKSTGESTNIPTDLAFASIGYKSIELPGMSEAGIRFDTKRGVVVNDLGRVPDTNVFVSGWVKSGPTGVIASTMMDSFAVGEEIVTYLDGTTETKPGFAGLDIKSRVVTWKDWLVLDNYEKTQGEKLGKPRSKLTSTQEMLSLLDSA